MNKKNKKSTQAHWEKFWDEKQNINQVYHNDHRIYSNLKALTNFEGKKILEVGAGSGRDSFQLAENSATVFVLDYAPKSLAIIQNLNRETSARLFCIQADAYQIPVADGTFDIVFHQGLLEHFRDPLPILRENYRVLKTGGFLLVDVPQRYHIYTVIKHGLIFLNKWFAGWETEFSIHQLQRLMQTCGFTVRRQYGNWMRPSLFYRMLREVLKKIKLQLPLYPQGFRLINKIRNRLRDKFSQKNWAYYTFLDIGIIGQKPVAKKQ